MTIGIWVLGDQLSPYQDALHDLVDQLGEAEARSRCRVLLIESSGVLQGRTYHCQKLVLVWSAMRHFAAELRAAAWHVDYREANDFAEALHAWLAEHSITELHVMEPAERPFRSAITKLWDTTDKRRTPERPMLASLIWHRSTAFLWSRDDFAAWARPYRQLRLELFYREGRRRFGVLMGPEGEPLGGQWNFDHDNRKSPPRGLRGPEPLWFEPDSITRAVLAKVEGIQNGRRAAGLPLLPGSLASFGWAVTRHDALAVVERFIDTRLDGFGPYQDAMVSAQPTLWHALLSPYLNLGLLHPLELIRRLEQAGLERGTPLASLEGVIRQILGWREYTNGLYGLFGLLAGLDPQALTGWFHRQFIDGYDWVMQTNVIGMGLFADGGLLASKPYAASGAYINRMSTYCKGCRFNVKARHGPDACPFNSLYWDFLARHQAQLVQNPRMGLMMKQLAKLDAAELDAIRATAAGHRQNADPT
jgi:deoxyribodipyrimidine photolyase-related protein